MSAVTGGGNYISDGQIMEWLASQQDRIYGDLKTSMDLADHRAHFADDLNDIKAGLAEANRSHDFSKVDAQLQALMDKYGSDPSFAETCEALHGVADQVHKDATYAANYDVTKAANDKEWGDYYKAITASPGGMANLLHADVPKEPEHLADPVRFYSDKQIEDWTKALDGKLDIAGKNDQLTMIHIQELKATLDQGAQLGSTFISSGDKTSSAIINNIA